MRGTGGPTRAVCRDLMITAETSSMWMKGRHCSPPFTTTSPNATAFAVMTLTARSNRIRGEMPWTVANRRMLVARSPRTRESR